jgi:hypothetical protein
MQSNGCILCPDQCKFIWKVSWASLASVTYAIYRGHYSLSMVPGSVLLTSLNYWRLPNSMFRKYLDMSVVGVSLSYQLLRSIGAQRASLYYLLVMISVACYPVSNIFYSIGDYWTSTYIHSALHLIANISNVVLYSGDIVPFKDNAFVKWLTNDADDTILKPDETKECDKLIIKII